MRRDLVEDARLPHAEATEMQDVLSDEAAQALLLDLPPDGKHILWKVICTPGQYIWHFFDPETKRRRFKGVSEALLRQAFGSEPTDSGWLPLHLYRWGSRPDGTWVVSFRPSQCYDLQLIASGKNQPEPIRVRLPSCVFCGIGQAYYIWATKRQTFFPTLPLFSAPLPNVYEDGRICFGDNTPPAITDQVGTAIEDAWHLFITSPFNADLSAGKSRARPDDVRAQLIQASQHPRHAYPLSDLLAYRTRGNTPITAEMAIDAYLLRSTFHQRGHMITRTPR